MLKKCRTTKKKVSQALEGNFIVPRVLQQCIKKHHNRFETNLFYYYFLKTSGVLRDPKAASGVRESRGLPLTFLRPSPLFSCPFRLSLAPQFTLGSPSLLFSGSPGVKFQEKCPVCIGRKKPI